MITIIDKSQCCGCTACASACPKHCIVLKEDEQGFLYPRVDESKCIDCHLCEKVCPVLKPFEKQNPQEVFAIINPDEEIRLASSSGGVFTALAKQILHAGGIVFGAAFDDNWQVHHISVTKVEDLALLRSSKYVQSRIEKTYTVVEEYLKKGTQVLFSGTPCQIAGLKHYLRKEYDNLLSVDVVCHGVPSPLVWEKYLETLIRPKGGDGKNTVLSSLNVSPPIGGITFRDKRNGWQKYGFVVRRSGDQREPEKFGLSSIYANNEIIRESHNENIYMRGFLKNLYLRPSCFECPSRCGKCASDLTLGDFWNIDDICPKVNDDKGVSLVLVNTEKGGRILNKLNLKMLSVTYKQALAGNPVLERSPQHPKQSNGFWQRFPTEGIGCIKPLVESMEPTLIQELIIFIKKIAKRTLITIGVIK